MEATAAWDVGPAGSFNLEQRGQLDGWLRQIQTPVLRARMGELQAELLEAVRLHGRIRRVRADVEGPGGTVMLEPGGPNWLREQVGGAGMHLFDRLVGIDLLDRRNPRRRSLL